MKRLFIGETMSQSKKILIILGIIIPAVLLFIFLDSTKAFMYEFTNIGLHIEEVLAYSLIATTSILIVLAIVSRGGILGEVQYLVGSFLLYFFVSFVVIGYMW